MVGQNLSYHFLFKTSNDNNVILNGCIIKVNDESCRAEKIERLKV